MRGKKKRDSNYILIKNRLDLLEFLLLDYTTEYKRLKKMFNRYK